MSDESGFPTLKCCFYISFKSFLASNNLSCRLNKEEGQHGSKKEEEEGKVLVYLVSFISVIVRASQFPMHLAMPLVLMGRLFSDSIECQYLIERCQLYDC